MQNRRQFIRHVGTAAAGAFVAGSGFLAGCRRTEQAGRRQVMIGGRRVRTIDTHSHCFVREVVPIVKGQEWASILLSSDAGTRGGRITPDFMGPERVAWMDEHGVDVQMVSINPYWFVAERGIVSELIPAQNEALAANAAKFPGRFAPWASVALQFPDLAAQQLDEAVKKYNMPGAAIASNINGTELGSPTLDPFWAKCVELGVACFLHPQAEGGQFDNRRWPEEFNERLAPIGPLGQPLDTAIGLAHMIFEGTFDRFPGLRIIGAHGAGFLPSYIGRPDASCEWTPKGCAPLKKKPSDYFKEQIIIDSLVFDHHELRLRVEKYGVQQVMLGTDHPAPWPTRNVDDVLDNPFLNDAQKEAILSTNALKMLKIQAEA